MSRQGQCPNHVGTQGADYHLSMSRTEMLITHTFDGKANSHKMSETCQRCSRKIPSLTIDN